MIEAANIQEQIIYGRAIEAVNWGMPVVNFDLMYKAMVNAKGSFNQIVYWSRTPSWKNQTLTPNTDVIYIMPFFNTKDVGPVVLEIPPAAIEAVFVHPHAKSEIGGLEGGLDSFPEPGGIGRGGYGEVEVMTRFVVGAGCEPALGKRIVEHPRVVGRHQVERVFRLDRFPEV